MRAQAHIEKIVEIRPIPKADRIEVVQVLGWDCVALKGDFKVGDYCVYIEIDSLVPPIPIFEFLEERRYRVRTIKLRKQISQGLALPIDEEMAKLIGKVKEGKDVSEKLGVTKFDPQIQKEKNRRNNVKRGFFMKFLMGFFLFRKFWFWLHPIKTSSFPTWIPKSDETRVQNKPVYYMTPKEGHKYYTTEKLEGQSNTTFYKPSEKQKKRFGVCSRNLLLDPEGTGNWQSVAKKYNLAEQLSSDFILEKYKDGIAIQGEIIAPGLQGNIYRVTEPLLYIFNIYDISNRKYLSIQKVIELSEKLNIPTVPILDMDFDLKSYDLKSILKYAEGFSALEGREDVAREGVVIRTHDPKVSFKAVSNSYLLKQAKREEQEDKEAAKELEATED